MARRVTSPVFVGRSDELAILRAAFDAARSRGQVVLVGGDAGVGKSRLVDESLERWRADGGSAAVGGCVELSATAGFAPLAEVLRAIRRSVGNEEFDTLVAAEAPSLDGLLRGVNPPRAVGPDAVLSHTLALLDALGEANPGFVVVVEDVHWADPSTRDLLAFLARAIASTRVALVATYRSDDVHRRHPLRPLLGELGRRPDIEHVRLGGLSRSELTMMLAYVADAVPDDHDVDEIFARSEGNPFFAEELAAAREGGPLPVSVRDAMLLRASRLSDDAQLVLREAAALGMDVAENLLVAVTDRSAAAVAAVLREGVAHQLLVIHADGCSFRHALLREALYDDLLPGERQRLHQRAAEALRSQAASTWSVEGMRWALVAHHADAAGDQHLAFTASVRAAEDAEAIGALADAAGHFERALALWARVPEPAAIAGTTRAELLVRASGAVHHAGDPGRAVAMLDEVLDAMDDTTPPEERAIALVRLGDVRWAAGDEAGSAQARHAAVDAVAGRPASEARASALAALARHHMLIDRFTDAEARASEALDVADRAGSGSARLSALCAWCFSTTKLGRGDEGVAAATEAVRLAEAIGTADELGRAHVMLSATLLADNRLAEVLDAVDKGNAHARRSGMLASDGVLLGANQAEALMRLGRWDEAADVLAELVPDGVRPYGSLASVVAVRLARSRGERVSAAHESAVTDARAIPGQAGADAMVAAASLAADEGRHDRADVGFDQAFELAVHSDHVSLVAATGAAALEALADRMDEGAPGRRATSEADRARADVLLARVHDAMRGAAQRGISVGADSAAYLAAARAEHGRATGHPDPEGWAEASRRFADLGWVHAAAHARFRESDAVLRCRGPRHRATAAAVEALAVAERLRARPLAERVRRLAQLGRLDLGAATSSDAVDADPLDELGISRREREVLVLLAAGQTNRQIADRLFISPKTASVHVTHLLQKLGVSSRIEAAAVGQRHLRDDTLRTPTD